MWSEAIRFAVLAANRFFFNGLYFVQITTEGSCGNGMVGGLSHGFIGWIERRSLRDRIALRFMPRSTL
jgi:hypothetical protein